MRPEPRVCLSVFLVIFFFALMPSGRLFTQQAAGAQTPAPTAQEIDKLTGPIALYPDAIVIQILTASKNYETLKLFSGWLGQNANLKGGELQDAAQKFGFSDALVALAPFPEVVKMMAEKPDWTKALGQAVTDDKKGVGDSIQRLRGQAQVLGNLKTTPQQVVVVTNIIIEKTVEQQVLVVTNTIVQIQPANPQVIYVPTYPQTVYVQPAPPPSYGSAVGGALVGFTVGVIVADSWHHHYNYHEYWEDREDFYEDRQDNYQQNQDQRQESSQQRQSERQGNQDQRQNGGASAQSQATQQRSGTATAQSQGAQRQPATPSAQSQGGQRQPSAAPPSSYGGRQTSSRSSGMSSSGFSGYQSGSATRAQSSRGSSSMSASRGGGRTGGGRR